MKYEPLAVRDDINEFVKDYLAQNFDYVMFMEDEEEEEYRLSVIQATLEFIKKTGQFN